jgi:uncharacterized membrane protein YeaQ/YmgE (transglycosylase-associated protein family)
MSVMSLIAFLIVGVAAGWIAGNLMKGRGFGLLGNMVVGVAGAFLGGFLFRLLGLGVTNIIGSLITAVVGAVVLLLAISMIKKA